MRNRISRILLMLFCVALPLWLAQSAGRSGEYRKAFVGEDSEAIAESEPGPEQDEPEFEQDEPEFEQDEPEPESEPGQDEPGPPETAEAIALNAAERIVFSYDELKEALGKDNGVTTVYFGGDITMQITGISVHSSKTSVEVVGLNPLDPEQSEPFTLTDYRSSAFGDTIHVDSSGTKSLRVRDLNLVGKNYYGSFSVRDSSATAGLELHFERVDYNGPQFIHHRTGTTRLTDCVVRIHGGNGGSANQEFSEGKNLIFEGANTIETETSGYSIFWHPLGGGFQIADDSSLTLISPNTSTVFGVFYAGGAGYNITVSIGRRSVFDAGISTMLAPTGGSTLSRVTVEQDGGFYLYTTKTAIAPVFSMGGDLLIKQNAAFKISAYGGPFPVLDLRSGNITIEKDAAFHIIAAASAPSLVNLYGRSLICHDPADVLLYNPGNRDIQATTYTGTIFVNAQQVNYWNVPSPGGPDNPPLYHWKKANDGNMEISGELASGANANFSGSLSENYAAGDSPGIAPSPSTFNMAAARVLAFGRLELTVHPPATASDSVMGFTAPGALVSATLTQEGEVYSLPVVTADEAGEFVIPSGIAFAASGVITVNCCHRYLYASRTAPVSDKGGIEADIPESLSFSTTGLDTLPRTVGRVQPDWKIKVSDTRGQGGEWSLYVRLLSPLATSDLSLPDLEDAIVFVDEFGTVTTLDTHAALRVYSHSGGFGSEQLHIGWPPDRGILASIRSGPLYADRPYAGSLEWTLVAAP